MLVKVCGMREDKNIEKLLELRPDFMGLIFYAKSPRFVGEKASKIQQQKYVHTRKVGVFVNSEDKYIMNIVNEFGLDMIQLHGNESPEQCQRLRTSIPVIKAFSISCKEDIDRVSLYEDKVDYFLFDTKTSGYGGSGNKFDWNLLRQANFKTPFFLSGGIDEEDIDSIKSLNLMGMMAVDLNSKFETSPALKDTDKLARTINKIRS